jgi:hypothetical protein
MWQEGALSQTAFPDYATIKYDSGGQQQWVAYYNGPDNNADFAEALCRDASGVMYVTGESGIRDKHGLRYHQYDFLGNNSGLLVA